MIKIYSCVTRLQTYRRGAIRFIAMLISIALFFFLTLILSACTVSYPEGKIKCGENQICPPDLKCRTKDNLCMRPAGDTGIGLDGNDGSSGPNEGRAGDAKKGDANIGNDIRSGAETAGTGGEAPISTGGASVEDAGFDAMTVSDAGDNADGTGGSNNKGSGGSAGEEIAGSGGASGDSGSEINDNPELVYDPKTHLTWKKCAEGQSGPDCDGEASLIVLLDAHDLCDTMVFAGHDDWRIPTIYEFVSTVDYSVFSPAINLSVFPNTPAEGYWSSTPTNNPAWNGFVLGVDLVYGEVNSDLPDKDYAVRCVRGNELNKGQFSPVESNDGNVVEDAITGLIWQACPVGQSGNDCSEGAATLMKWLTALDYCEGLEFAGEIDWRVPAIDELISIVDYSRYGPSIDPDAFPKNGNLGFWSSSEPSDPNWDVTTVWGVDFANGQPHFDIKSRDYALRCVRGGT